MAAGTPRRRRREAREAATGEVFFGAHLSYATIGLYLFLVIISILIFPNSSILLYPWVGWLIVAVIIFLLLRYLSTVYRLTPEDLHAYRILGGRRVPLEEVRRIQLASLRELSPVGFFGSWGYRGRMWSPVVGKFDNVQTNSNGVLIFAGPVPLFVTPRDRDGFVRELSRRVRSYRGPIEVDDGTPELTAPTAD